MAKKKKFLVIKDEVAIMGKFSILTFKVQSEISLICDAILSAKFEDYSFTFTFDDEIE